MCTYILYIRREDAILAILCIGLCTTFAGGWLNGLIFHDDIKMYPIVQNYGGIKL